MAWGPWPVPWTNPKHCMDVAYIILAITYLPEDKDPICKIYGINAPALQSFNSAHGCNSSNNDI